MTGPIDSSQAATAIQSRSCVVPFNEGTYIDTRGKTFANYVNYAIQTIREYDLILPEDDHFILIVQSALATQSLFFDASVHQPEQVELDLVFETFVLNCVRHSQERGN